MMTVITYGDFHVCDVGHQRRLQSTRISDVSIHYRREFAYNVSDVGHQRCILATLVSEMHILLHTDVMMN